MGSPPRALPNEPKLGPPSSSSSRDNQPPNLSLIWLKPNISETTSPRLSVLGLPVKGAPSSTPRAGFRRRDGVSFVVVGGTRASPLGGWFDQKGQGGYILISAHWPDLGGFIGPFLGNRASLSPKFAELQQSKNTDPKNQDGRKGQISCQRAFTALVWA
ncbi:hypothetical protein ACJJTC_008651 [Scirpophaga incertulas]